MQEFVTVASASEIEPGELKSVTIDTKEIAVANVGGEFYAVDNSCAHEGCPLAEGDLDGFELTCSCHGSKYDVRTGALLEGPSVDPVDSFPVRVENGNILVAKP